MTQLRPEPLERFQRTLLCAHFDHLVRAARELESLKSCLAFLCEKDAVVTVTEPNGDDSSCCTEAPALVELAKSLGWQPDAQATHPVYEELLADARELQRVKRALAHIQKVDKGRWPASIEEITGMAESAFGWKDSAP